MMINYSIILVLNDISSNAYCRLDNNSRNFLMIKAQNCWVTEYFTVQPTFKVLIKKLHKNSCIQFLMLVSAKILKVLSLYDLFMLSYSKADKQRKCQKNITSFSEVMKVSERGVRTKKRRIFLLSAGD